MNVLELRNYLLKPGCRDRFVSYFRQHFLHSQQAYGAIVSKPWCLKDEPDRFFWFRGFESMEQRSRFLPAFYGSETWQQFGPAANEMMLEWHDVHLVKPLLINELPFFNGKEMLVVDYFFTKSHDLTELQDIITHRWLPCLQQKETVSSATMWASELSQNDFPRLPVQQDKDLVLVITGWQSEVDYRCCLDHLNCDAVLAAMMSKAIRDSKRQVLTPALLK